MKTCADCKHFNEQPPQCRFNPPKVFWVERPVADGGPFCVGAWPPTQPTNWCSQMAPRLIHH